jgi:transcription antitermination factor NusG
MPQQASVNRQEQAFEAVAAGSYTEGSEAHRGSHQGRPEVPKLHEADKNRMKSPDSLHRRTKRDIQSDVSASQTSGSSPIIQPNETSAQRTPIDAFLGTWWVLHTRARNEKVVAKALSRQQVDYFLPLVHYKRTYGGRINRVEIPLFPGYVFLCGQPEDRLVALKTNRVANVLEVSNQEQLKHDLRQIALTVESGEPVDLFPGLQTGARCRVTAGSMIGIEGVVIRRQGPWRVYVGVEFLGQSAELEIDPSLLDIMD